MSSLNNYFKIMKKELTDAVKLYGRNQNYLLMTSSDKYMGVRKHSF